MPTEDDVEVRHRADMQFIAQTVEVDDLHGPMF